jgi:hypothetical protein
MDGSVALPIYEYRIPAPGRGWDRLTWQVRVIGDGREGAGRPRGRGDIAAASRAALEGAQDP